MKRIPSVALAVAIAAACSSPSTPTETLAGDWMTAPIPSGAFVKLSLASDGSQMSGTGQAYGLESVSLYVYAVTGEQAYGRFSLTLVPDTGTTATYVGHVVNDSVLTGTWSSAGAASFERKFFRVAW